MAGCGGQPRDPHDPAADRRRRGRAPPRAAPASRRRSTDDEFVAMPAVPLDVSSAVAAGKQDEFARDLGAGEDMLTAAVPTTPSSRNVWIATEPLSGAGAQELRDLGFRYLVMPDQLYVDTVDDRTPRHRPVRRSRPARRWNPAADRRRPAVRANSPAEAADDILAHRRPPIEWAVRTGHRDARRPGRRPTPPRAQPRVVDARPRRSGRPAAGRARDPGRDHAERRFTDASTLTGGPTSRPVPASRSRSNSPPTPGRRSPSASRSLDCDRR